MATGITEIPAENAAILLPLLRQVQDLHARTHPEIFRSNSSDKEREAFLRGFLSREEITALAYRSADGAMDGYLIYEIQNRSQSALKVAEQIGFLHQIAVDETKRGQGIGSRLVDEMKSRLRIRGVSKFRSEHFAFNEASACFMRSLGLAPLRVTVEGDL